MQLEVRSFGLELRAAEDRKVQGYAAVFNSRSELIWGSFREEIAFGAFTDTLRDIDHEIYGLWNHNHDIPLASRGAKNLDLDEDDKGLSFEMRLSDDSWSEFAYSKIKDGTVRKMSFGFRVVSDEWRTENREEIRTIRKVDLYEVSPVLFPAYKATSAEARSILTPSELWEQRKKIAESGAAGTTAESRWGIPELLALNTHKGRQHAHKA